MDNVHIDGFYIIKYLYYEIPWLILWNFSFTEVFITPIIWTKCLCLGRRLNAVRGSSPKVSGLDIKQTSHHNFIQTTYQLPVELLLNSDSWANNTTLPLTQFPYPLLLQKPPAQPYSHYAKFDIMLQYNPRVWPASITWGPLKLMQYYKYYIHSLSWLPKCYPYYPSVCSTIKWKSIIPSFVILLSVLNIFEGTSYLEWTTLRKKSCQFSSEISSLALLVPIISDVWASRDL